MFVTVSMVMIVIVIVNVRRDFRPSRRIISRPDGYENQQYLIQPHRQPMMKQVIDKAPANNGWCAKNNHDPYKPCKIHIDTSFQFNQ
jgi:hypothetical protein